MSLYIYRNEGFRDEDGMVLILASLLVLLMDILGFCNGPQEMEKRGGREGEGSPNITHLFC